jgi:hypothetical protein
MPLMTAKQRLRLASSSGPAGCQPELADAASRNSTALVFTKQASQSAPLPATQPPTSHNLPDAPTDGCDGSGRPSEGDPVTGRRVRREAR